MHSCRFWLFDWHHVALGSAEWHSFVRSRRMHTRTVSRFAFTNYSDCGLAAAIIPWWDRIVRRGFVVVFRFFSFLSLSLPRPAHQSEDGGGMLRPIKEAINIIQSSCRAGGRVCCLRIDFRPQIDLFPPHWSVWGHLLELRTIVSTKAAISGAGTGSHLNRILYLCSL